MLQFRGEKVKKCRFLKGFLGIFGKKCAGVVNCNLVIYNKICSKILIFGIKA